MIEIAYNKSEALKNTNVHKNCLGPKELSDVVVWNSSF